MDEGAGSVLKLTTIMLVLAAALLAVRLHFGYIPVLGSLPGDMTFALPQGPLFLPLGSSVALSALLVIVTYFSTQSNRKDGQ